MIISLVVAMDEERGIGKDGRLPWHLSDDLKRFKNLTMGHHLIMGRKTYESIGKALPGRVMLVITRQHNYSVSGGMAVHSLKEALELAEQRGETEVFIAGGGEIFAQALPLVEKIYLTQIKARLECDTFFPEIDFSEWHDLESSISKPDSKNEYPSSYQVLLKIER